MRLLNCYYNLSKNNSFPLGNKKDIVNVPYLLKVNLSADLPTSKTCKSGDVEKRPRKTWRLGPQTWRFPKYVLNENKNGRFLVSRYSLPYLCTYCILFPHILKTDIFNIASYYLNFLAISRFSDTP